MGGQREKSDRKGKKKKIVENNRIKCEQFDSIA